MLKLDTKTRKIMRQNGALHANSSVVRIYLTRHEGGRGLVNLEHAWEQEALSSAIYLVNSEDPKSKEQWHYKESSMNVSSRTFWKSHTMW